MERPHEDMYAITLQTPGGPLRGKMRLHMNETTASGTLYWESFQVPFSNVPVRNGEASFQGKLKNPPLGFTIRVRRQSGGEVLQGTVSTPIGSFPAYGRRMEENPRTAENAPESNRGGSRPKLNDGGREGPKGRSAQPGKHPERGTKGR